MLLRFFPKDSSRHHLFTSMLPRQKVLPSCQALKAGMVTLCCPGRLIHHRLLITHFPEQRDVMQVYPAAKGEMGALCTGALGPAPFGPPAGLPPPNTDISHSRLTTSLSRVSPYLSNYAKGKEK